jgi:pimeloyl-ACP methyl ester carboxylesterase
VEIRQAQIDLDEGPIAYRCAGTGPPVLLLHGALSDSREWRHQFEGLSGELTVIACDLPGSGGSFDPPEDFGLDGYADAVAAFVRALELPGPPHVVGLSFGGGLALALADRHPTVVRSLVLASAYAGWAGSLPPDEVAQRVARVLADVEQPPSTWAAAALPSFFAGPVPPGVATEIVTIMSDSRPSGIRAMVHAFADADLRDALGRVHVPTLLLYGDADGRAPRSVAEALHAGIAGSQLRFFPGAGHLVNIEAAAEFNAAVLEFLLRKTG